MMAKELAQQLPGSKAFRLVVNNGADAGQCVFHAHIHFLAGKRLEF
jgi:histidine triad (HIT) family protein